MKSSWINIDRLGTKGIEPDLLPVHRDPQSLDLAMNVRAVGPNLANAGGYAAVTGGDFPEGIPTYDCPNPITSIGSRVHPGTSYADGYRSVALQGTVAAGQITYARNDTLSSNGVNVFLNIEFIIADYAGNQVDAQTVSINTGLDGTSGWDVGGNTVWEGIANTTQIVVCQYVPSELCALVDYVTGTVTPWAYNLTVVQGLEKEGIPGKLKQLGDYVYYHYLGVMSKINKTTGVIAATLAETGNFMVDDTALRLFSVVLNHPSNLTIKEINVGSFTLTGTTWVTDQAYASANDDYVYGVVANKHYALPPANGTVTLRSIPLADGGGTGISQLNELATGNADRLVMRTGFNTVISATQAACMAPGS